MTRYQSINPTTETLIAEYPTATESGIEEALEDAVEGFDSWRDEPLGVRTDLLLRLGDLLEEGAAEYAALMAEEMGKPLSQGLAEVQRCASVCRYYAGAAEEFLAPSRVGSDAWDSYIQPEPLGPVLAIMPWNFPFWQVFRFAAPALAAGNSILLKHAPNTPGCALRLVELLEKAEAPMGLFQNLFLTDEQAGRVITDSRVAGVTLTGSTRAGMEVARRAGGALKPMVMELGGSDPFIVFGDADIEEAARTGVLSRCVNSGQSCIAAKRFLIERSAFRDFAAAFCVYMADQVTDDPLAEDTEIGPLARRDLLETLQGQVKAALDAGAKIVSQGEEYPRQGFFHPPMVLANVHEGSPARTEELFGPVAILIPFTEEEDLLEIANETPYGLGASIWTSDFDRAQRLIPRIKAGSVFVNGMVKSDPRLPFGGIKHSGFGRELAREGMLEFMNLKTVWIG